MPLSDLGNPFITSGTPSSSLGGTTFPSAYDFAKRFVNAKSVNGSGSNGVTALDDPTYLGFSLMFDITSPLFNGATLGNTGITESVQSPSSNVEGNMDIQGLGGTSVEQSSGNASYPSTPSAIGYLDKIGEANRVEYLKAFVQGLQEVVKTRPYYFQTIGGLLEAWNKSIDFGQDPYTGSSGADGVTIGCLEAIDLKITALFNLYRMAVYDVRFKRFVLPKNLMRFNVYVNVHEIRKFKTVIKSVGVTNASEAGPKTADHVNENTSQIRFKFSDCVWDLSASGKIFDGVTNVGGAVATTEMKWGYGVLEMISQYSGFDSSLAEDKQQNSNTPGIKNKTKSFLKDKLSGVVDTITDIGDDALANLKASPGRIVDLAKQKASSLIDSAVLGNIFGVRNQIIGTLQNPKGLINAALGAAIQASGLKGENAFDPSNNSLGDLNSTNVFGAPGPAQDNGGLASTNIFE